MIKLFCLILICYYVLWLIVNYVRLIITNSIALNTFKELEKLFIKRYELFENISSEGQKYIEELKTLPVGIKFLNRKLALNYIVTEIYKKEEMNESEGLANINAEIFKLGQIYNKRALKLKNLTEIFPASFYARFLRIKPIDFYVE